MNVAPARRTRSKIYLLLALGVVHVFVTLWALVPGYLVIDEIFYHWMTKNFSETAGLEIWNGYEEFQSPELAHPTFRIHHGHLFSPWPNMFPILAVPMYRLCGVLGLFLMNSIAFLGLMALCFATARLLFHDIDLALNACLILALATFEWEYSQAIWPHATAAFLVLAAFYLAVSSYYAPPGTRVALPALGAGLLAGLGSGIRLDVALVFPALTLPFLFSSPRRLTPVLLILIGAVPGLTASAIIDHLKFGQYSPFSMGGGAGIPVHIVAGAAVLVAVAWVLTRPRYRNFARSKGCTLLLPGVALGLIVILGIKDLTFTRKVIADLCFWLVDTRVLDAGIALPAMQRTPSGGVVYVGALKKALLQSLPFLALLMVPIVSMLRRAKDFSALAALFILPVTCLLFYACLPYTLHQYGGLCLNQRYFTLALPFLAILCAYGIKDLRSRWGVPFGFQTAVLIGLCTLGAYYLLTKEFALTIQDLEFPVLVAPLLMAGLLLSCLIVGECGRFKRVDVFRSTTWVVLTVSLVWSCLVAFDYDYAHHRRHRMANYYMGGEALKVVSPDSIFFTAPYVDPFMRLIEKDRVRIAFPAYDLFKDFPRLLDFQLRAGRRAFAVFPNMIWEQLQEGPLASYNVTPLRVFPGFFIGEITNKKAR